MSLLERPDGISISWEKRGSGPPVVLSPYALGHPGVYEALLDDLSADHTVITYDARGTGQSTRRGPYDIETDAADLAAVVEQASAPAVVLATANGMSLAVRAAAGPDSRIAQVIGIGMAPIARSSYQDVEGMVGSDEVIGAFQDMISRDYRGAMRSFLTAANPQMTENELRNRVTLQTGYCPGEVVLARFRAWAEDDPERKGRELGRRLTVLTSADIAGPWLPGEKELRELVDGILPEARMEHIEEGAITSPGEAAAVIRSRTAESTINA